MIGHFGGIVRVGSEFGLEAEFNSGRGAGILFEAEVFVEDPKDVSREAFFDQQVLPRVQSIFKRRTIMRAGGCHSLLRRSPGKPVNKKWYTFLDPDLGIIPQ